MPRWWLVVPPVPEGDGDEWEYAGPDRLAAAGGGAGHAGDDEDWNDAEAEDWEDEPDEDSESDEDEEGGETWTWKDLLASLDGADGDGERLEETLAAELARKLYAGGVRQFHFYTLNRAELSYAICHLLGRRPGETA